MDLSDFRHGKRCNRKIQKTDEKEIEIPPKRDEEHEVKSEEKKEKEIPKSLDKSTTIETYTFDLVKDAGTPKKFTIMTPKQIKVYLKKSIRCKTIHDQSDINFIKCDDLLPSASNGFHEAVYLAATTNCPLVLSPDIIWTTIMQGLANHISVNERSHKMLFLNNSKPKLNIRRDEFIREIGKNKWTTVFSEFSKQIRQHIGRNTHDLIINDFSTTGTVEKIISDLVLLDNVQPYFSHHEMAEVKTIPSITLTGTEYDWKILYGNLHDLIKWNKDYKLGLDFWLEELDPVVKRICRSRLGKIEYSFWHNMYKINYVEGVPYIHGWFLAMYPYFSIRSTFVKNDIRCAESGVTSRVQYENIPNIVPYVPFIWNSLTDKFEMRLMGGILGVAQDPNTLALMPEFAWVVDEIPAGFEEIAIVSEKPPDPPVWDYSRRFESIDRKWQDTNDWGHDLERFESRREDGQFTPSSLPVVRNNWDMRYRRTSSPRPPKNEKGFGSFLFNYMV